MILVELIWKMALVDSQQVLGSIQMLFSGHSSEVKQDSQDSRLELFFSSSGSGSGNGDDFGGFGGGSRGFGNAKGGFPGNAQFTFSSSKR